MQGTSKWVPDTFNMGEIINSVDECVLAAKGETVEVVPFKLTKTWEIFTDDTPAEWVRSEKWTPANDDLPWQFTEEDEEKGVRNLKRQRQYGFHSIIAGENTDFQIPVLINFRSSAGFKEGKKIASHFATMKALNKPGYTVTFTIGSESVKDGDKNFQKFVVKKGRMTSPEEVDAIRPWLTLMQDPSKFKNHSVEETTREDHGSVLPPTTDSSNEYTQSAF